MKYIAITIGGVLVDTDDDTKLGLSFASGIFSDGGLEVSHSFGLSIPATAINNKVLDFSETPDFPGVRQSARCVINAGGVSLNGRVTLVSSTPRRYELLFVYGDLLLAGTDIFAVPLSQIPQIQGTIVYGGREGQQGGTIPNFGFYHYHNGSNQGGGNTLTSQGTAGMFPSCNFGWLLTQAAAFAGGYTCNFPADPLRDPYKFGIVLPTMNTVTEHACRITGSARSGWTDTLANLNAAGLTIEARRYKRGAFNSNITVFVLKATRKITIEYIYAGFSNTQNVFAGGMGYDFGDMPNFYFNDRSFELNAGDWFTVVNHFDIHHGIFHDYWDGSTGYTTAVDCTFTVKDDAGTVQAGDTLNLQDNLPDMTLAQICQAYCWMCDCMLSVNSTTKELTFIPLSSILSGSAVVDFDTLPVVEVKEITRYIDGFSRHNLVRCKSAEYVCEEMRFERDYPCENDALDAERVLCEIPFNEGNWEIHGGAKEAVFEDVTVGDNGDTQYNGQLSIFYEAPVGDWARHIQTINDEGVGVDTAAATLNSTEMRVTARVPFHVFAGLAPGDCATYNGRTWCIKTATWSEGLVDFELLYLKS